MPHAPDAVNIGCPRGPAPSAWAGRGGCCTCQGAPSLSRAPGWTGEGKKAGRTALGSTKAKPGELQGGILEGGPQVLVERAPAAFWRAILGEMA